MNIKKNVNLIRTRIIGNSICTFFLISIFYSCKTIELNENIKYNFFNCSDFYNEKINIQATFFGDIEFLDIKKNSKDLINVLKKNNINISNLNKLILYGKTNSLPNYSIFLFRNEIFNIDSNFINDGLSSYCLFKKEINNEEYQLLLIGEGTLENYFNDGQEIISNFNEFNVSNSNLNYFKILQNNVNNKNYLFVIDKIINAPIEQTKTNSFYKNQVLLTLNSFFEESKQYDSLINVFERNRKNILKPYIDSLTIKKEFSSKLFFNQIDSLIKDEKIIILNENHWKPNNRLLLNQLLPILKKHGFNNIAIEALDRTNDSIFSKDFSLTLKSGFYTRESQFQNLIYSSINQGFNIISYDNINSIEREIEAVKMIENFVNSGDKLVLFVGFDHVLESNKSKKWLAELIKERLNINPLTFNQTEIVYDELELALLDSESVKSPLIKTGVDYYIINNLKNPKIICSSRKISLNKRPKKSDLIIEIYDLTKYKKNIFLTIPLRILRLENFDKKKIDICLSQGNYHIIITDKNNVVYYDSDLIVN